MTRRLLALLAAFVAPLSLLVAVAGPADAASGRVTIPKIGVDAPVIHVGLRNGALQVGHDPGAFYTVRGGDPPCDSSGSTLYAGHAWRSGHGVADRFGELRRGDIITVAGCRFKVSKTELWKATRRIGSLSSTFGDPRIVLYGCKADDYSKRTVVFARLIRRK